jgi:hypothetical protein
LTDKEGPGRKSILGSLSKIERVEMMLRLGSTGVERSGCVVFDKCALIKLGTSTFLGSHVRHDNFGLSSKHYFIFLFFVSAKFSSSWSPYQFFTHCFNVPHACVSPKGGFDTNVLNRRLWMRDPVDLQSRAAFLVIYAPTCGLRHLQRQGCPQQIRLAVCTAWAWGVAGDMYTRDWLL